MPTELSADVNISVLPHSIGARVMGVVSVNSALPAILEQEVMPTLSVAITDALGGVVIATTRLSINPSPPLFERSHYNFEVVEGTSRGVLLGPIRLIDPNGGTSLLTPSITPNEQGTSSFFSIITTDFAPQPHHAYFSYDLVVQHQFDYEQVQQVSLQLVAVDLQDQSLSSSASVTVNILPLNEFTPHFLMPRSVQGIEKFTAKISKIFARKLSSKKFRCPIIWLLWQVFFYNANFCHRLEAYIAENQPRQSLVETFQAFDQDLGPDGLLDYSITAGNEDDYFGLSGVGFGEVLVKRSPLNPGTYTLTITASDRGLPPRSSNATLVVHVTAIRDVDCLSDDYGKFVNLTQQVASGDSLSSSTRLGGKFKVQILDW